MLIDLKFDTDASTLFADLLGASTETFLHSTSRYTRPILVLKSQSTTIEANAKAKEETVPELLIGGACGILTELCFQTTAKELRKGAETFQRLLNAGRQNSSDPDQMAIQIVGSECDQSQGPERVKAALRKALQLKKSLADWKKIPSDKEIRE
ncbi:hypothetical protein PCASD_25792 [Puccinia coronata f. sp. avenae]|uniref:Uncharacterized protein n=1 Tax=Puccinia coronata f. sp. avenae TaxID=200324 RepID=A0A2N5S195_9BASI|nr:hypothetical protein PCASD_25792 [Puccinia coronata f. sp. avenae]